MKPIAINHRAIKHIACLLLAAAALSGCGLVDTAASGAANAKAAADEAREGKKTEERVQKEVEAAQAKDAERRKAAEDASTQ